MRITFSEKELNDLLVAWAAITFAFALILGGIGPDFISNLIVAGVTVGVAFLLHELAHKFVAQRYGCWAEFRKWNFGLALAVILALMITFTGFGFLFAAPGAVMISGFISREQNGKIAAAGPLVNIALAVLFIAVAIVLPQITQTVPDLLGQIIFFGFFINAWLALFNMIPFPPLDGSKVIAWSFPVWLIITLVAGFMVFGMFF